MNKIPVQKTIVAAYGFLFAHIGKIISVTGLPALIFVAADYITHVYAAAHRVEFEANDPQAMAAYIAVAVTATLVMLLACAMAALGIVRAAFGGNPVFHPFDRVLWRMFAADIRFWLGVFVLTFLAAIIAALALALAGVPLGTDGVVTVTPAAVLAGLITWAIFFYVVFTALRMGFLLPAVVAVEEKGGLVRAHKLAQGNLWQLLAVGLALGLPIFILWMAAGTAIVGAALSPDLVAKGDPTAIMRIVAEAFDQRLIPWEIYNAIIFILYSGLFYSGGAYAYRAVAPGRNPLPAKTI